jgi:hypothetical protein
MSEKRKTPETPDESIPQDPGIPGPGTKEKGAWPPESAPASSSAERGPTRDGREHEETSVSEAIGQRTPRHRADEERETER